MLQNLSIKKLYALALAEGEGVGTAYEYFAKRLALAGWLRTLPRPQTILVAGLPQKYGSSLDFVQLAAELGSRLTVIDEREEALQQWETAVATMQKDGWWSGLQWSTQLVTDMILMNEITVSSDLALSSEVLQRLPAAGRAGYWRRLTQLAPHQALFAPNGDNRAHTDISGLAGLRLDELRAWLTDENAAAGYLDMPPFPPGITRSDEQREQATTGTLESLAMWGLGYYARGERWLPHGLRQRQSHIVYAFSSTG